MLLDVSCQTILLVYMTSSLFSILLLCIFHLLHHRYHNISSVFVLYRIFFPVCVFTDFFFVVIIVSVLVSSVDGVPISLLDLLA